MATIKGKNNKLDLPYVDGLGSFIDVFLASPLMALETGIVSILELSMLGLVYSP